MGKVYSPHELANGLYPKWGGQKLALEEIMQKLEADRQNTEEGASQDFMGYGSVVEGRANLRSDVDIIAIFPDEFAVKAISKLLVFLMDVSKKYHVEIDPILLSKNQALSGDSTISNDSLLVDYLRDVQQEGQFVVGRPADLVGTTVDGQASYYADMRNYFSAKSTKFQKAIPSSEYDINYRTFQRALELPAAMRRKFSQAVVPLGVDKDTDYKDYEVLQKYNQQYNAVLDETLDYGVPSELDVTRYARYLRDEYPGAVFRAARLSLMAYDRLVNDQTLKNAAADGRL